ncbi:SPOR domain-containing protein [Malaciobacter mytili]|uniref:SPOR domain-containing protein n=1 Tax=Malaciobacter mytili TaxID=603050 RepID=UPI003BB16BFC
MEIKGEDFLKKVQIKQETEELEQRLSQLKKEEEISFNPQPQNSIRNNIEEDAVKVDIADQELGDIMLGTSNDSNEINKKKYLILGLVLIILFLLTIVIIRLINSPSEDSGFETNKSKEEKILENDNIEEQYQKIIDEKLKNIKEQNNQVEQKEEELNIQSIEEKEKKIEEETVAKPDVFGIKEEVAVEEKKVEPVKEEVAKEQTTLPKKKPVVTEPKVEKKPVVKTTTKPEGTFVQVGAFSKQPAQKYLDKIVNNGFAFTIYKVNINGKIYNKVLIGPYKNRAEAEKNMEIIKRKLNISSAFILRF